jgi:hypothetical protein
MSTENITNGLQATLDNAKTHGKQKRQNKLKNILKELHVTRQNV